MAGRTGLFDFNQKCVLITIVKNIFNALDIAGGLALFPELLSRTAPVPGEAGFDRLLKRGSVHVRDHQYLVRFPVLDDSGYQAFFIIFQVIGNLHDWTGFIINQKKCPEERSTDNKKTGPMRDRLFNPKQVQECRAGDKKAC